MALRLCQYPFSLDRAACSKKRAITQPCKAIPYCDMISQPRHACNRQASFCVTALPTYGGYCYPLLPFKKNPLYPVHQGFICADRGFRAAMAHFAHPVSAVFPAKAGNQKKMKHKPLPPRDSRRRSLPQKLKTDAQRGCRIRTLVTAVGKSGVMRLEGLQ